MSLEDTDFPGDHSGLEPPDSISNSEVKQTSADDSVEFLHVKVGHRQGFILKAAFRLLFFIVLLLRGTLPFTIYFELPANP